MTRPLDLRRDGRRLLPIAVADVDLDRPADLELPPAFRGAHVLFRQQGVPRGAALLALDRGRCSAARLAHAAARETAGMAPLAPPDPGPDPPLVTVAVCTRDRPDDLARCLAALTRLEYPELDLLVVDNAPSDGRAEAVVRDRFPGVRYVREERPGLNRARNRALAEARGPLLAYTDDDVEADPLWVAGIMQAFRYEPDAGCVTGLILPARLDVLAQLVFEVNGTFSRGFERFVATGPHLPGWRNAHLSPGIFGAGANMAFRTDHLRRLHGFDPALDVGTPTGGGGDLEMFLRLLQEGGTLVYDPRALVRHHHRRDMHALSRQFAGWGGYYAMLTRTARAYPHLRGAIVRRGLHWFLRRHAARLAAHPLRRTPVPAGVMWAELRGCLGGLSSYDRSLAEAAAIDG
jgi:O-antigen biosynthesis protein